MIVAVTGASGHVGANIVRELISQGYEVRALVHTSQKALEGLDVELSVGSVLDHESLLSAFTGVDYVIHTAGYISIRSDEWDRLYEVNVRGTRNVLNACLQRGVKRLIHISSIEALNRNAYLRPVDETFPPAIGADQSPYAQSKAYADEWVHKAGGKGLDFVILYPTSVVGPFDFKLGKSSQAIMDICKGRLPILVHGSADWVDARDVAKAAVAALNAGNSGEGYLLSGQQISLAQWVETIETITGNHRQRIYLPLWLVNMFQPLAALYFNILDKEPLITSVSLAALKGNWNVPHNRASRDLGYQPREFMTTMKDTIQWMETIGIIDRITEK